jgi:hypothetical protein
MDEPLECAVCKGLVADEESVFLAHSGPELWTICAPDEADIAVHVSCLYKRGRPLFTQN